LGKLSKPRRISKTKKLYPSEEYSQSKYNNGNVRQRTGISAVLKKITNGQMIDRFRKDMDK
jgi:hypothetical protein